MKNNGKPKTKSRGNKRMLDLGYRPLMIYVSATTMDDIRRAARKDGRKTSSWAATTLAIAANK